MGNEQRFAEIYPNLIAAAKAYPDGTIKMEAAGGQAIEPESRLAARALAKVAGIPLDDTGLALSMSQRAALPTITREARAYIARVDPARLPYRRTLRIAPVIGWKLLIAAYVTAPWFFASLFFACIGWGPGATFAFLWKVTRLVVQAMIDLARFALQVLWHCILWVVHHPAEAWMDVRWVCCALAIIIPICAWERWSKRIEAMRQAGPPDFGFGRSAIHNFREESPFGDAQLAGRASTERALLGQTGGFAPTFKE